MCERRRKSERLTVGFQCQGCGGAQNPGVCHRVLHQADVASYVRGLHLGDVQVPRVLGDEAPAVLGHEGGELVEHPAVDDLCRTRGETTEWAHPCRIAMELVDFRFVAKNVK